MSNQSSQSVVHLALCVCVFGETAERRGGSMLHCFVVASNSPKLGKVKLGALASAEITTASSEKKSNNTNVALPQANRHRQALSPSL